VVTHILHGEPCNIHRESLRTCANRECESANLSRIRRESARIVSRTFANLSRICANLHKIAAYQCKCVRFANPSRIRRKLSRICCESARILSRTFANLSRICAKRIENFRESFANLSRICANMLQTMQYPRHYLVTSPVCQTCQTCQTSVICLPATRHSTLCSCLWRNHLGVIRREFRVPLDVT
jgi:hypothetical protein